MYVFIMRTVLTALSMHEEGEYVYSESAWGYCLGVKAVIHMLLR